MSNAVIVENWKPGTTNWRITNPALFHEIEGYVSTTSALPGETIKLFISSKTPTYSMQIFRMGWYRGAGGRLMKEETKLQGIDQANAITFDDGFGTPNATKWQPSYSLQIPQDWPSGVYLVKLSTIPQTGTPLERYMIFVVKSPSASDLLWLMPVNTYHAYNAWPGDVDHSFSLYANFLSGPDVGKHINAVSFNRPYADGLGVGHFLNWDYSNLFWLESNGYDVTYATSEDLHTGKFVSPKSAILSLSHDEYWTFEMRAAIEAAVAAGTSVGFFGANPMYWQVRFERDSSPAAINRNMVCYKHIPACILEGKPCLDENAIPIDSGLALGIDPWDVRTATPYQRQRLTGRWRDVLLGRAEQNVVGQMYQDYVRGEEVSFPWVVFDNTHWAFRRTGLTNRVAINGIIGQEFDRVFNNNEVDYTTQLSIPVSTPATLRKLAESIFVNHEAGEQTANTTIYQVPHGGWVFSAGSITWSWGLADVEGFAPEWFEHPVTHKFADSRFQLFTANILDTFITRVEPDPATGSRIAVLQQDGICLINEGKLEAVWWPQGAQIAKVALYSDRVGLLTKDNNLYVKAGPPHATWMQESWNVQSFALEGSRIGVLDTNGVLNVKEGVLSAAWVQQGLNVQSFTLSGNRIAMLDRNGVLNVKEGALNAAWVQQGSNVQSFALSGNRIGMLDRNGVLNVKEGAINVAWTWESSNVQSFALSGSRIAVLNTSGVLFVKEGALNAAWVQQSVNVQSFALSGNRIGVLDRNGVLNIKEGAINVAWTWESSNVQSFALSGSRIGVLNTSGVLFVKEGGLGAAWVQEGTQVQYFALGT